MNRATVSRTCAGSPTPVASAYGFPAKASASRHSSVPILRNELGRNEKLNSGRRNPARLRSQAGRRLSHASGEHLIMKTSARSSASGPSRHAPAGITRPQPSPRSSGRRRTISRSRRTFTCWNPSSSTNKSGLSRSSAQRPERLRSGSTITAADGCSSASMSGSSPASPGVRDGDTCNGNSGGCALYPRDSTTARSPRPSLQPSNQSTTGVLPVPPHAMFPTETHWHAGRNAGEPSFSHFALRAASIRRYSNETGVSSGLSRFCQINGFMAFLLGRREGRKRKIGEGGEPFWRKVLPLPQTPSPTPKTFAFIESLFSAFPTAEKKVERLLTEALQK